MPDTYDYITLMCRLKAVQRRNKELVTVHSVPSNTLRDAQTLY